MEDAFNIQQLFAMQMVLKPLAAAGMAITVFYAVVFFRHLYSLERGNSEALQAMYDWDLQEDAKLKHV